VRSNRMVMRKKAGVSTAILSLLYFSTFQALAAPNKGEATAGPSDVACILIMMRGTDSPDNEKKQAFQIALTYFMGRYEAGHGKESLVTLVRKEIVRQELMELTALNKEQAACGAMVTSAGRLMKTVGSELQKQGR